MDRQEVPPSKSHPAWVRGLKREHWGLERVNQGSHPAWVRGLKQGHKKTPAENSTVAPRVGAWIETDIETKTAEIDGVSHPAWVRGLKLIKFMKMIK